MRCDIACQPEIVMGAYCTIQSRALCERAAARQDMPFVGYCRRGTLGPCLLLPLELELATFSSLSFTYSPTPTSQQPGVSYALLHLVYGATHTVNACLPPACVVTSSDAPDSEGILTSPSQ